MLWGVGLLLMDFSSELLMLKVRANCPDDVAKCPGMRRRVRRNSRFFVLGTPVHG
ncbi:hypothetical protein WMF27_27995 [Sorangium sp. So ce281]|uniref:hypothetical protein n=1 Tax=unclassified Sorangium TaxID=2621164 RepID=UPI003F5FE940